MNEKPQTPIAKAVWNLVNERAKLAAENKRLREALRVCLSHWFKGDNPNELQVNVARFKELCDWDAALRREEA